MWVSSPEEIAWREKVLDAGYAVPTYPAEWFGRGYPSKLAAVIQQEFRAVKAPGACQDKHNIPANTLFAFGSDELKHELLRDFLTGAARTCLLYSEPGAGSDLAGLRTTATLTPDGDAFILNGQKVWTSGAHDADVILAFVRTDPDVPKHKGISVLVVPADTEGVVRRPFPSWCDREDIDFNEVFFTDARVKAAYRLGDEGAAGLADQAAMLGHRHLVHRCLDDLDEIGKARRHTVGVARREAAANVDRIHDDASFHDVLFDFLERHRVGVGSRRLRADMKRDAEFVRNLPRLDEQPLRLLAGDAELVL